MRPTRLFIIDPHDLSRNGLEMLVTRARAPITLVGAYHTLAECERQFEQNRPHVLLLDDLLPKSQNIYDVIAQLTDRYPGLVVLVLSARLQARYLQRLIQSGAMGFIYKDDHLESTLVSGIEVVRNGHFYVSPQASGLLFADQALTTGHLNQTDLEVLRMLDRGFTTKEIGGQLQLVPRSISRIRRKLREALDVRTNDQIVAAAREQGLLPKQESVAISVFECPVFPLPMSYLQQPRIVASTYAGSNAAQGKGQGMARIVVADEMDLEALGIRCALEGRHGLELMATYQQPSALYRSLTKAAPEILLLSEHFDPDNDILRLLAQMQRHFPKMRVLVLGVLASGLLIGDLLEMGAAGYLHRLDPLHECLIPALMRIQRGRTFLSPTARTLTFSAASSEGIRLLNHEARSVLRLLAEGLPVREIAAQLDLPQRRVYRVRDKLRRRFGAVTNEHLIRRAVAEGMALPPG